MSIKKLDCAYRKLYQMISIKWLALIFTLSPYSILAADLQPTKVEVIDPYAEVRSGPGRGYPVFYAIEKGESIELLNKRPGWYEIKAENGKVGWTTARQISRTIQATGEPADLPTVGYGDFIKGSWWSGFSTGQFNDGFLKGFEYLEASLGYRFNSWLAASGEWGRTYGSDTSGDIYGLHVSFEPYSHWKLSPMLSVGAGKLSLDSQPRQVSFSSDDIDYNFFGIGASYYLGRSFIVNSQVRWYSISEDDADDNISRWQIGVVNVF